MRANSVGEGGAAATITVTGRSTRCAFGWLMTISCTVGAPLKLRDALGVDQLPDHGRVDLAHGHVPARRPP